MKLLQRLVHQLGEPRLNFGDHSRARKPISNKPSAQLLSKSILAIHSNSQPTSTHPSHLANSSSDHSQSTASRITRSLPSETSRSRLLFVLAVVSLTGALGHRYYNAPKLDVGKAAPQTIVAPATVTIEDTKATEEKRKAARKEATSVLMLDRTISQQTRQILQRQLDQGTELRRLAGPLPFTQTATLSLPTQTYLRKLQDNDWQKLVQMVDASMTQATTAKSKRLQDSHQSPNPNQQRAVAELRTHRRSTDVGNYFDLTQTINQARLQYATALTTLSQPDTAATKLPYDASLLDLSDVDWQQTQNQILQIADRILAQGIPSGLPQAVLTNAVKLHVKSEVPAAAEPIATSLLLSSLQPNLIPDAAQTQLTAERAAKEVEPEMVTIRQGEVIVYSKEMINSADFALLDHFGLSRRGVNWFGLIGYGGLISGAVGIYCLVQWRYRPGMRSRDQLLILLLTLSTPLLIALRVPSTNLPAIGLLVGTFYGSPLGATVTALLAIGLPIGTDIPWNHIIPSAAGGILCGWMAGRSRSREELALLGSAAGVLQGLFYLVLNVVSGTSFYLLLGSTAIHALLGLAWCIVAIGISPYLEQLFDLVTSIRLVELTNPNRPLLKRLAAETPGTFQHTLFVATLAEAAARALGCNVELVRVGTLYHDIGKMHDPMGFIENQMGGLNKHDLIDDPWKSTEIIKKHVTEGLVIARRFRLPKAVQAFIPEHQGTMLIAYFYHQAQQRVQQAKEQGLSIKPVEESDFRYDGPSPQSRETGIVMLADSCEAALRSLKNASREEALAMINKIMRARWQDNQMVNSGLTREDMSKIANIFVEVWQQFNHQRIAYPKLGVNNQPSAVSK